MKRILSITFLLILCNVLAIGQTGWERQYPLSNNNELKSVCFTDANTGYAVGEGGTILKTTDAGINWTLSIIGMHGLNDVTFISSDTGYAVGKYGTILKTTNAGATWLALSSNTQTSLNSVCFANNNTGVAVGYNKILKTTDAGITWSETVFDTNYVISFNDVFFTNDTTGYIVGSNTKILKTTDAGATWSELSNAPTIQLLDIHFLDENTGYATGYYTVGYSKNSVIYKTTDAGTNWTTLATFVDRSFSSVFFTDTTVGYAIGNSPGSSNYDVYFYKTLDGGATWVTQERSTPNALNSVYFTDANTGYIIGQGGMIFKTTDAGQLWNPHVQEMGNGLGSLCFTDINTGYAVGDNGTILKTSDTGITWTHQPSGTFKPLYDVCFPSHDTGYVVGEGIILKTSNAGATWITVADMSTELHNNIYSVFFTDVNSGYALKRDSVLLKTTDGGNTWSRIPVPGFSFMQGMDDVFFTNANIGYIVGEYGKMCKTTDAGNSWIVLNSGTTKDISSIFFVDMNNGFAVGESGLMLQTINAGNTWTTLNSVTTSTLINVNFTDINNGYVLKTGGGVYKTTNGGSSWTLYDSSFYFNEICFTDSITGFGVNSSGQIFKTTNAGINWSNIKSGMAYHLTSVYFVDNNTGYAVDIIGTIFKSTNAGKDWLMLSNVPNVKLNSIYFPDTNTGFAVGSKSTDPYRVVLKTTNAGATWEQLTTPSVSSSITTYQLLSVCFVDNNIGFTCGDGVNGVIYKTVNGGATWTVEYTTNQSISSIFMVDHNIGYAVNGSRVLKSTDGGDNWGIAYQGANLVLISIHFTDANTGYAVGIEGNMSVIYKTTNGGSIWNKKYQDLYFNRFNSVYFVNETTGYAVGSGGLFVKTTNAGETWTALPSGTGTSLNSCFFTDPNTGYIVGNFDLVLKTYTGGEYVNNNIDSLKITSIENSSVDNTCTSSFHVDLKIKSLVSGPLFNEGDSIDFHVWFGDGTDTIYSKTINHLPLAILCNLEHNYPSYGVYSVKCKMTAPDGRSDSLLVNDLVSFYPTSSITGSVVYSGGPLNAGTASVILFNENVSGNFQQIDSAIVDPSGAFTFQNMVDGNYYLHVNLTDNSTYPDLFNTYLDSTIEWQNADVLPINCNTDTNVIIHMIETVPSNPGNGHITGTIQQYTNNKTTGDPLPGIEIYLKSQSRNKPVSNNTSGLNGTYKFTEVPIGSYTIYVDIPGIPMIQTYTGINVTASDTLFGNLNFYVDTTTLSTGIYTDEIFSVIKIETLDLSVQIFPNPVKNELSIEVSNQTEGLTIELLDINGKSFHKSTTGNRTKIEMNAYSAGVYLIKIQSKNTVIFKKIIKE
ncbi:MAG: YCF48-related protein [Bacteroidota bacterium]